MRKALRIVGVGLLVVIVAALGFQAADFDRIVRHGVKPGGLPALMPSVDFA